MAPEKCIIFRILVAILNLGTRGNSCLYQKPCYSDFRQILDLMGTKDYSSRTSHFRQILDLMGTKDYSSRISHFRNSATVLNFG